MRAQSTRLLTVFTLCAAVLAGCGGEPKPEPDAPERVALAVEKYTLGNGLQVILHPDRSVPTVATNLRYNVGVEAEMGRRPGLAHVFEHLTTKVSGHIAEGEAEKALEGAGAYLSAGTTFDSTSFRISDLAADRLELALWAESDRMGVLLDALTPAGLYNQQQVIRNERRDTIETIPYGLSNEAVTPDGELVAN